MKHSDKPSQSTAPGVPADAQDPDKVIATKQKQEDGVHQDTGRKIDRPGFDLSGSSGETHAGTGLGLGENSSDTPGDRRLPGRRPDNDLTIPRWSGPEGEGAAPHAGRPDAPAAPPSPKTKKGKD